jgi:hypothetical protein
VVVVVVREPLAVMGQPPPPEMVAMACQVPLLVQQLPAQAVEAEPLTATVAPVAAAMPHQTFLMTERRGRLIPAVVADQAALEFQLVTTAAQA